MEATELLAETRWKILKELSGGAKSASDLAKKTGMTTANATIQLQLLEAKGFAKKANISSKKSQKKKKGKPKKTFELGQEYIILGLLANKLSEKRIRIANESNLYEKFTVATMLFLNEESAYAVNKFCLETDLLKKAGYIGLVKSEENEIELFVVSDHHLEHIRQHHSNAHIETLSGKTKKIISWSHTSKEVKEGMDRSEEYFLNLIKAKELFNKKDLSKEWGDE